MYDANLILMLFLMLLYQVLIILSLNFHSGDHDMCVPFTGSEAWTRSLGYKIVDLWRPWYFGDQIAGYFT